MKIFFALVILFTSSASFGISITADQIAKDAKWSVLLDEIIAADDSQDTIMGKTYGLSKKTVIEEDKKWTQVYISLVGEHSFMGGYTVTQATISSEDWVLSESGESWIITQRFFYMDPKGEFKYALYREVEKFKNTQIKMKDLDTGTLEEQKKEWMKLLNLWL